MKKSFIDRLAYVQILAIVFFAFFAACPGCPNPTPTQQKWIDCTSAAVRTHGLPLIPKINDCVTGVFDVTGCLISLISPAAGISADVLACVVRDQGKKFAETADDTLECNAMKNADTFIVEHIIGKEKMMFVDGYTSPAIPASCSSK